jgi:transcriptional regulator with XRE-family HTH domain
METTDTAPTGEALRALRDAAGMSQRDLARISCIARGYIADLERDRGGRRATKTRLFLRDSILRAATEIGPLDHPKRSAPKPQTTRLSLQNQNTTLRRLLLDAQEENINLRLKNTALRNHLAAVAAAVKPFL